MTTMRDMTKSYPSIHLYTSTRCSYTCIIDKHFHSNQNTIHYLTIISKNTPPKSSTIQHEQQKSYRIIVDSVWSFLCKLSISCKLIFTYFPPLAGEGCSVGDSFLSTLSTSILVSLPPRTEDVWGLSHLMFEIFDLIYIALSSLLPRKGVISLLPFHHIFTTILSYPGFGMHPYIYYRFPNMSSITFYSN